MSYASRDDLVAAFGETEISNLEAGGRDSTVALTSAAEEADSYLAVRYAVPVSPVPEHLKAVVADLARYRLYADAADGEPQARYTAGIAWLKAVSAGTALLPGIPLAAGEGSATPGQVPARSGQAISDYDWSEYV